MDSTLFPKLHADDEDISPTEIESFCVNCEKTGTTRLLLTSIPHYKDVILMSFHCDECGYHNNEIQSGAKVQEQGLRLVLKAKDPRDLNRQIVKSEYASVIIPELDFEIPHCSQAGEITTLEGVLTRVADALSAGQSFRTAEDAEKISAFLSKLDLLRKASMPFTLIVDDPSGNSFIENPRPAEPDAQLTTIHYHRSLQQDKLLALVPDDEEEKKEQGTSSAAGDSAEQSDFKTKEDVANEVLHFGTQCPDCRAPIDMNMKFVNIPNFKEVVIMATTCSSCGHRSSEVKSGGAISDKGQKLTLFVSEPADLSRDLLKSETCNILIPELELELGMGALSGRFTTVEGILVCMKDQLSNQAAFWMGDSGDQEKREQLDQLFLRFDELLQLKQPFRLILDDPAGNSYIESIAVPDSRLTVEQYDRNFEQNEALGLNDMKVDNYEQ